MYKKSKAHTSTIEINTSYIGERIEEKIERIMNNKEPITDGAPIIYTERSKGVLPEHNIRTDRFEIAVDAMDKVSKSYQAKREERAQAAIEKIEKTQNKSGEAPANTNDKQ